MELDRAKASSYAHRAGRVSTVAQQRIRSDKIEFVIDRVCLAFEYLGYIATFYILMAIRVTVKYSEVRQFDIVSWYSYLPMFKDYVLFLGIFLILHAFMLMQNQLFSGKAERSFIEQYLFRLKSLSYAFLITLGITFLLKTTFLYSRVTLVTFLICILAEAFIWLGLKKSITLYLNNSGVIGSNVLIVGAGKIGRELRQRLTQSKKKNNRIVGYLDDIKAGGEILGKTSDLEKVLLKMRVDIIYITIPSERRLIESMLHTVYKYKVDIRIIPEMFDRMATVFDFRSDLEYPCLQIVKTPLRGMNIVLKRMADIIGSLVLLVCLSPLFLLLSGLIKLDSKGTIFFKQTRIGKNGIAFKMIKFRSMNQEAEQLKGMLEQSNEKSGPIFKMSNDPRVTKLGKFLRKYSLDELPQLWNVLRGKMSLIGPRPPLPDEVEKYSDYHWRRMDVLPGMTGLWQVSGRSDLDFEQWIDLDIQYIERWSFMLEMKILLKTIPTVIRGTGAY